MLVLTRKLRQSIMIGDDVEITVLAVSGEKVRLGIDAPKSVPVFRKEIYIDMHGEVEAAAEDEPPLEPPTASSTEVAGDDPVPLVTPEGVIDKPPTEDLVTDGAAETEEV